MEREQRAIDGSGNNRADATLNQAGTTVLRIAPVAYDDDVDDLADDGRPNPRDVSNAVVAQPEEILTQTPQRLSDLFTIWGQFIAHDTDLVLDTGGEFAPIPVGPDDPFAAPIPFERSNFDPETGTGPDNPREQINSVTGWIDGSMIYGSDDERAEFLRAGDGRLKTSAGDLLPFNDGSLENLGPGGDSGYIAGDIRARENLGLTTLHTLFVREHNWQVGQLAEEHPDWDANRLFDEARLRVEAEIQHITFDEFLPQLLGPDAIDPYAGYDPDVDPRISQSFLSAAFRIGHTLISSTINRVEEDGSDSPFGHLTVREAFFTAETTLGEEGGIGAPLRGLAVGAAQALDTKVVEDLRSFLVAPDGSLGLDLAALNIQRGRDHGLPPYNEVREAFGLPPAADFADITSDDDVAADLAAVYGNVDVLDLWVGGLAEDAADGALVGPLFQAILADQFTRLRDGDRLWAEGRLDEALLAEIESTSLADIIRRNTEVADIQDDVFLAYNRVADVNGDGMTVAGMRARDLMIAHPDGSVMEGDDGDDQLEGKAGVDIALYDAPFADAAIDRRPGETLVVLGEDTDMLRGMDLLAFADGFTLARSGEKGDKPLDAPFYLAANPDVAAAVAAGQLTAGEHFDRHGAAEGRDPNPLFDTDGYLAGNPDVAAAVDAGLTDAWTHYFTHGWGEGRDPSARFDSSDYMARYPDVAAADVDPMSHFLAFGADEGRLATMTADLF
ncbi:MAG: peroxidase [Alphaproteobacteria bacterium]|jgi:hypothetical protein|nr:peroxidase [Alphaproteobacteria bacterium]